MAILVAPFCVFFVFFLRPINWMTVNDPLSVSKMSTAHGLLPSPLSVSFVCSPSSSLQVIQVKTYPFPFLRHVPWLKCIHYPHCVFTRCSKCLGTCFYLPPFAIAIKGCTLHEFFLVCASGRGRRARGYGIVVVERGRERGFPFLVRE